MRELTYKISDTGCWEVTSHVPIKSGYIRIRRGGNGIMAHRYMYEKLVGKIPDGLVLMHLCDNPCCVNPKHLKPGTQGENMRDCKSKGRQSRGEKNGSAKLSEEDVQTIRVLLVNNIDRKVADIYNVHVSTITAIRNGSKWKSLKSEVKIPDKSRHLSNEVVRKIRELISNNVSLREISKRTKINRETVTKIRDNKYTYGKEM